jgi:hypothetical protein
MTVRPREGIAVGVRGRPNATAVRQPVERVAGDHEQSQRRGELCLRAGEAIPFEGELKQRVLAVRGRDEQVKRIIGGWRQNHGPDDIAGAGRFKTPRGPMSALAGPEVIRLRVYRTGSL